MKSTAFHLTAAALLVALVGCATPPSSQVAEALPTLAPSPVAAAASTAALLPADVVLSAAIAASAAPGEAAAPPVDPLRPEAVIDPDDEATRADLWQRIRNNFRLEDLHSDLVRQHERYYASKPDYVARMTERASLYLFHIVEEVERRNMPSELALLPFIESAFNPQAMSVARASGMWQFIPSTGRHFELTQNLFRDDRRDVLASTRAALDYLGKLHAMFGDWHLALAAYNWGEGNVQRAVARNRRAGKPTHYTSLKMPAETRHYVPKLQAVKNIIARPETFAVLLPPVQNHPYFLSVPIERDIDVPLAARLAGLDLDDFKALNPQMNQPLILASGTPQVLLPYDNANQFVRAVNAHQGPLASWTVWMAPRTMRPAEVARLVGMSEDELRQVNRIPPYMLVRSGSTLLVPRSERAVTDIAGHIAERAMIAFAPDAPPARRVTLKAGKGGESVASVARRYRLSASQVASWNGVAAGASFKAGETIVVYIAQQARSTARGRIVVPARVSKAPAATRTSRR